jgi:hypothetical protein
MSTEKTNNFTLYNHCTDKKGRRFTVAAVASEGLLGVSVNIGIARYNEHDNYCKKLGRRIAEGRAQKRPVETSKVSKNEAFAETRKFLYETCEKMSNDVSEWL